jgi:hypothetical protein
MPENTFEANYDVTKKSKFKKFYDEKKFLIYSVTIVIILLIFFSTFYTDRKEKKRVDLSTKYVQAKIFIEDGKILEATNILKKVVFSDDPTYSSLSLFLIIDNNLINNNNEVSLMFDHILKKNKFKNEIENLIIYKKAMFNSNFVSELKILEATKPLLKEKNIWKPHALFLLGNYYVDKSEYIKASEFFLEILSIPSLSNDLYDQARSQLSAIPSE